MVSTHLLMLIQIIICIITTSNVESSVVYHRSPSLYHSGIKHYGFPVKLVKVTNTVAVPVPYPVPVTRKVPFPITVTKPVPYPVPHPIPVQVTKPVVIQQPVPVPVVKPVVIRQPVFNQGYPVLNPHAFYQNVDYLNYLKHQAYQPNNVLHHLHPHFSTNSNNGNPLEYNELKNEPHNEFIHGYGVQPAQHAFILPAPNGPAFASSEVASNEQDLEENERVNSQEMYENSHGDSRPFNSGETDGENSSHEENTSSTSSRQYRTYK